MSEFRKYMVTVRDSFGNAPGLIPVTAKSASDAISQARREMRRRGYDRHDGPFSYTAKIYSYTNTYDTDE